MEGRVGNAKAHSTNTETGGIEKKRDHGHSCHAASSTPCCHAFSAQIQQEIHATGLPFLHATQLCQRHATHTGRKSHITDSFKQKFTMSYEVKKRLPECLLSVLFVPSEGHAQERAMFITGTEGRRRRNTMPLRMPSPPSRHAMRAAAAFLFIARHKKMARVQQVYYRTALRCSSVVSSTIFAHGFRHAGTE